MATTIRTTRTTETTVTEQRGARLSAVAVAAALLLAGRMGRGSDLLPLPPPSTLAPNLPPIISLHPPIPTTVTAALASVPADVAGVRDQRNFDVKSWLEFIALNWPADVTNCGPRQDASILTVTSSPRVWETWKSASDVFVDPTGGNRPVPWCAFASPASVTPRPPFSISPALAAAIARQINTTGIARTLIETTRYASFPLPLVDQAVGGPLVDQQGRFVRYEERINKDEFDFVVGNDLWRRAGQRSYGLAHPGGLLMPSGEPGVRVGPIEVKAAWKVLTPQEVAGARFYTVKAQVSAQEDDATAGLVQTVSVGLVGFHITHKSKSSPQWTWATFEHADNLTSSFHRAGCHSAQACNNPPVASCANACCPDNCPVCPDMSCDELDPQSRPLELPVQVTRVQDLARMNPPDTVVNDVNDAFHRLLAGSVWANYSLIGTQWPARPSEPGGVPNPPFLANVTLETYNQGPTASGSDGAGAYPASSYSPFNRSTSSSCLKCHSLAKGTDGSFADFSFLLGKAF